VPCGAKSVAAAADTASMIVAVGTRERVGGERRLQSQENVDRARLRPARAEASSPATELARVRARERAFFTSRASATAREAEERRRAKESDERICICNARDQSPDYLPYPAEMTTIRP